MVENLSNYHFIHSSKNVDIKKKSLYCCVCGQPIISCINGPAYSSFDGGDVTCSRCIESYEEMTSSDCLNDLMKDNIPNWREPTVSDTTSRLLARLERCY